MSDVTAWVGHRIQSLRLERGWTQEQLAEYADLHVSYVSTLEKIHPSRMRFQPRKKSNLVIQL